MTAAHASLVAPAAEEQLLLCCARTAMAGAQRRRLDALLSAPLDWPRLFALSERHGLAPLLATHLAAQAEHIPAAMLEALCGRLRETQFRNLRLAGVLLKVLERFEGGGVRALTYKGPALAQELYGNLALRPFGDLDLLVAHADVPRARELLRQEGFSPGGALRTDDTRAETAGQFLFSDPQGAVLVELHSQRTLRHFPRPLTPAWLFEDSARVAVAGREMATLAPAKLLIALAVHGTKDLWSQWKWVCDVAEFLRVHCALDWSAVFDEARRLGCDRMLRLALLLARDLLDAGLPITCAVELRADHAVDSLAATLRRRMWEPPAEFSAPQRFFFRAGVCSGTAQGLRYALRLTTTPAEEDWTAARLPGPLAPLYTLLRPFRLLRKYGVTGR